MEHRVNQFEDLRAWQHARELTARIYRATSVGPLASDRALRDQLRRAAASIMANIAEGFERGRRSEFHQFLSIAKGSCAEVRSFLYVAFDAGLLTGDAFQDLLEQSMSVTRLVARLRSAVAKQRDARRK